MSQSSASLIDYQIGPDAYMSVQSALATLTGKNRIINGTGVITQRGTVAFGTTAGNFYGGPDRWMFSNGSSGAGITQSAGSMTINGVACPTIAQTVTTVAGTLSGSNYLSGFVQRIEGFNCYDLLGQQVTLSFWFKSSVAGTYSVSLQDGTAVNSCVQQFTYTTASTPQFITLTFPILPTTLATASSSAVGLVIYIGALNNGTYASTAGNLNKWVAGNWITGPTNAAWTSTVGNVMQATMVQLEAGPVATAYEREDCTTTYLRCLRYYIAGICLQGTLYIVTGAGISANLPVPMRAAPTIGGFSNLNIFGGGAPTSPGVVNTNGTTATVVAAQIDWASSSGSVGMTLFGTCTANAEL